MTTTNQIRCTIAETAADKDHVYRLRYQCYRRNGSIPVNSEERFSDSYDLLPNQFSFLLWKGEEPVATVRISVVRPDRGWTQAPSCKVFGDHPEFAAIARHSFVEASRLCFGTLASRELLLRLVANLAALADVYGVHSVVACPREEHAPIYRRLFGFKGLAAPRPYFGVSFCTELLGVARAELHEYTRDMKLMRNACGNALADLAPVPMAA